MSPNFIIMTSPSTKITTSCSNHFPSRNKWQQIVEDLHQVETIHHISQKTCPNSLGPRVVFGHATGEMTTSLEDQINMCWQTLVLGVRWAMKVVTTLATLFSSSKLIVEITSNIIKLPQKSSKFGGIPYKYISYESIIKPKTKRQLGETTIVSKAGSNKRNMVIGIHKK